MTSIIDNELLRELIGLVESQDDAMSFRRQTNIVKSRRRELQRIIAAAKACLPDSGDEELEELDPYTEFNRHVAGDH